MRNPLILLSSLALAATASAGLKFDFDNDPTHPASPQFVAAFTQAANIWSGLLGNDATIRIKISQSANGTLDNSSIPAIGRTASGFVQHPYADFRAALATNGGASTNRAAALAGLEAGPTFRTSFRDIVPQRDANGDVVLDGDGRAVPERDAGGNVRFAAREAADYGTLLLTSANAKALGLASGYGGPFDYLGGYDAAINFADFSDLAPGSHLEWDFDPSDGIGTPGHKAYDAVGVALHEIGHAMGFYSELDDIDYYAGLYSKPGWDGFVTPLDLYRYETVGGSSSARSMSARQISPSASTARRPWAVSRRRTTMATASRRATGTRTRPTPTAPTASGS